MLGDPRTAEVAGVSSAGRLQVVLDVRRRGPSKHKVGARVGRRTGTGPEKRLAAGSYEAGPMGVAPLVA